MNLIKTTRPKKVFYAKDVNMNYSFDTLAKMAEKFLGADLSIGDTIVCDNHDQTKRKMLQKTKKGFMIYYARMTKGKFFLSLRDNNGEVKQLSSGVLE
jgi:hypothetical protein